MTEAKSGWSREQNIAFENVLAAYPEDFADKWKKIAADVPGKTLEEELVGNLATSKPTPVEFRRFCGENQSYGFLRLNNTLHFIEFQKTTSYFSPRPISMEKL
uniref:Transcription factor DIVARICATA-like n=1 Tax=Nicotiana sylvestris TaxID=4096 RepID=A0A1U7Y0D3_NICSY|nr:PREDICTED: transcription factor DIVARICATA-like [Nicotiana sylvestris]